MLVPQPQLPKKPNHITNWFITYTKLKLLTRMRRLKPAKHVQMAENPIKSHVSPFTNENPEMELAENLQSDDWEMCLRKTVKKLHFGSWDEKEKAANEIRKLVIGKDMKRRKAVVEHGVIPPLVAMVGTEAVLRWRLAVGALFELANGSFTNKALMVEAGLLTKLPENIGVLDETTKHELVQLLLSISSLSNSQFSLKPSKMIPVTISVLETTTKVETKDLCLTTLLNLSSVLDNSNTLISTGVISMLITLSLTKETSEKSLATLGNLVVTLSGRKALERNPMIPEGLIEVMTWEDSPKCQESSAYILMNLAHHSSSQRRKMAEAGIVQVLLGVVLLGSPLAQKRASKILQWFKDERQVRMGNHSGPLIRGVSFGSPADRRDISEGRKLMKKIVKQSLYKNMETITLRANGTDDSSKLKALVISTSSKSLPY